MGDAGVAFFRDRPAFSCRVVKETSSASNLPDGGRCSEGMSLVWGWRTICVLLGFATGVKWGVVVVRGLVVGFWSDEGLFEAGLGGGPWYRVERRGRSGRPGTRRLPFDGRAGGWMS